MCPPKRYVKVPNPIPINVILFINRVFADVKLIQSHAILVWALNARNPYKKRVHWTQVGNTQSVHENKSRDLSYAATNKGLSRIAGNLQKLEMTNKDSS